MQDQAPQVQIGDLDEVRENVPDGVRMWRTRCRIPFTLDAVGAQGAPFRTEAQGRQPGSLEGRAEGDDEGTASDRVISGIASSTSVDFFETRMSREALEDMAEQMRTGRVAVTPSHGSSDGWWTVPHEWDMVIGRIVDARVERADVASPKHSDEVQYVLRVWIELLEGDVAEDGTPSEAQRLANSLWRRVQAGEIIGQSIGGWFTEIEVRTNDDGDVEDVIVRGVDLDHDAVTRRPANPDAVGLETSRVMRSILRSRLEAVRRPAGAPEARAASEDPEPTAEEEPDEASDEEPEAAEEPAEEGGAAEELADEDEDEDADRARTALSGDHKPAEAGAKSAARAAEPNPAAAAAEADHRQESDMSDEQLAEVIRSSVQEGVRMGVRAALEAHGAEGGGSDEGKEPDGDGANRAAPDPPNDGSVDERVRAAEAKAAEAEARAKRAEEAVDQLMRQPVRHARSPVPQVGDSPTGIADGYRDLATLARQDGNDHLPVVIERSAELLETADEIGTDVKPSQIVRTLRAGLRAAEADRLIVDPRTRGGWA